MLLKVWLLYLFIDCTNQPLTAPYLFLIASFYSFNNVTLFRISSNQVKLKSSQFSLLLSENKSGGDKFRPLF